MSLERVKLRDFKFGVHILSTVIVVSSGALKKHTSAIRKLNYSGTLLTREIFHFIDRAFVLCMLDYCNSALARVAKVYLRGLQSVQNMATRTVSRSHRCDHTTSVLEDLLWLPVSQRVVFKMTS